MKFLGVLSRFVLCTVSAVYPFAAVSASDPPNLTHATVQAKKTPVFSLLLDTWDDTGHHSLVVMQDFHSFEACKSAGLQIQARFGVNGEHVDFACVAK